MNLADWLKRSHPAGEQVAMVAAIAQAVESGHGQGTQYAGWSPSRIQIRGDGSADLSALDSAESAKEDLAYTAPEAADGSGHSLRSDVYSAGVILYEILAGGHPFSGLSVKQPRGAPKPLGDVRRDLPKDLADAVTACLERDPEWRPADLSYVLRVAQEAGAKPGRPAPAATAPMPRASTGRVPAAGGRSAPSFSGRAASSSSSRLPLLLAVLALVVAAGGGAYYYFMLAGNGGAGVSAPPPTQSAASPAPGTPEPVAEEATPAPSATLPSLADRRPTAEPATPSPTAAVATATPTRTIEAAVTAAPTATRTASPPPATAPPTSAPTAAPTAPPEPAALTSVAPPKVRKGQQHLLDVRGQNLRAGLQPRFQHKGKDASADVQVARQRVVDPALLQVLVVVAPSAPHGAYSLSFVDAEGQATNAVTFEISQ